MGNRGGRQSQLRETKVRPGRLQFGALSTAIAVPALRKQEVPGYLIT
jgi:hypothetical protein